MRRVGGPFSECRLDARADAPRAMPGRMTVTEPAFISPCGSGHAAGLGLYSTAHVEKWRLVTDSIHLKGGLVVAQLCLVGRLSHSPRSGLRPLDASVKTCGSKVMSARSNWVRDARPRKLDEEGIDRVLGEDASAARNAMGTRFYGVELNGMAIYPTSSSRMAQTSERPLWWVRNWRLNFLSEAVNTLSQIWNAARVGVRLSPWSE
jgi:N-ethylmaleimide reductase